MINNFKEWIKSAGIRALKTFAQTFMATIGTGAVVLGDVNWAMVLSSAALAAILSLVTSLAGLPEVKPVEEQVETVEVKEDTKVEEAVDTQSEETPKE